MKLKDLIGYCAEHSCIECKYTTACWDQIGSNCRTRIIWPMDIDDTFVKIAKNITQNWDMDIPEDEFSPPSDDLPITCDLEKFLLGNGVQILCEDDEKSDTNE